MALKLKICSSIEDNCGSLILTDTTEEYNSQTNTTGWGSPNITTSLITEAYITIVSSNPDDRGLRIDIPLSTFPTVVTGSFPLLTIDDYTFNDGEYTITYTIKLADETTYETKTKIFITCGVACCIHKLWLSFISDGSDSCGCSSDSVLKLEDLLFADALYKSLLRAAACLDTSTRDKLLVKLQALCSYTNCNC